MFSICYSKYGLPKINLNFQTEYEMHAYAKTWIIGDEDYIFYFKNGIEYKPLWAT